MRHVVLDSRYPDHDRPRRITAQNHAFVYDERIKVESVTQAVYDLALWFGEGEEEAMMSRAFGVARGDH